MSNPAASPPVLPGADESYWMHSGDTTRFAPLTDAVTVDVVVIGGGIAGLSAAWEAAASGRSVAVVEADRIAAGVTGHTTAKLTAQHTLVYDRLRRTRGEDAARLYARSQQDAVDHVAALAAELDIDCELERAPAVTYALDAAARSALKAEAEAARAAGLPARYVEETELPFAVAGAVRVADQAQFHPRKYLLGLAAAFVARGGRIYERSRVTGLHEGEPCRVRTESGAEVTARDVIVATGYPVFDRALLFTRLSPRRELVVAAPIDADAAPHGMYITEDENKRSVRTAPLPEDGRRLLIVTGESFTPGAGDTHRRFLRLDAWMRERFPVGPTAFRWAAQDNDPTDTVALVGRLRPGARHTYVATGFGGWGMSGGVMAGRLLAALLDGTPPQWAGLYDPLRVLPVLKEAPALLGHQAEVAQHFVGDRLRTAPAETVEDIAPGGGAVVRVNGKRCAVHRDADGALHAVSARCTHLGCVVAYNPAETTWECPCHGSRFGVDGAVLQGPAVRPLEPRDLD
ncbi:Glycine/D-amino acid oxidase [Actinacidiphila alni]|uniref:Glycine/D-amino acid oxidase n=1 Tax=Actinacidiphila alni TaxID=380248 RepID=A0A1I2MLG5_9ACTN|nr:FAD-dependent oxidoreductase [Actinacidiphila alni]SFF89971.1 Glycine/D-amino acid oxidase [Actinacidiphila alni]